MLFQTCLAQQLKLHPSMQPQDGVKLCYQAAYGPEHLLNDLDGAWRYLEAEFNRVSPTEGALFEPISPDICRVNLSVWKERGLPPQWLFRIFAASCKARENAGKLFSEYLQQAEEVLREHALFPMEAWDAYLQEYKRIGMPAVHHSTIYREQEQPAYRIADRRFCKLIPILEKAVAYAKKAKPCIIAIDGRAASGKTTLAEDLQNVLDAAVIHMDDFFVPPALRSAERFQKPGENIHHERFTEEVLPFLSGEKPFSYRIFDCSQMDYNGTREVERKPFRIVEGSYSCHPVFGSYGDITVFSDVTPEQQITRIRNRNGEEMLKLFRERWIPMEEAYFTHYKIKEAAHILLSVN